MSVFSMNAGNDVALAADRASDQHFTGDRSRLLLVPMAVFVLAADVGLIDLDNAHQLAELRISKTCPHAMTQIPSGAIGTEAHHAMDLQGRNALLAGEHQIDDLEPRFHGNVGVLEDRSDQHREAIAAFIRAFRALPMEWHSADWADLFVPAASAANLLRPTALLQIELAGIIGREQPFELRDRHLRGEFDAHSANSHRRS